MRRLAHRAVPLLALALPLVGCGGDAPERGARASGARSLDATARAAVALMKSGDAGNVDAVLPSLDDVEAILKCSLAGLAVDEREREEKRANERGGAKGALETLRATVTRRARTARESAGKDLDWARAEFDRVDEPSSKQPLLPGRPEEVASVTFYVKAGGASYRFRAREAMQCAGGWNFGEGWRYEGPDLPHDARVENWEAEVRSATEGTRKAQGRARQLVQEVLTQEGSAAPSAESVLAVLREIDAVAPRGAKLGALLTETGAALDSQRLNPEDREHVERVRSDARFLEHDLASIDTELQRIPRSGRHEALLRSLEQRVRADLTSSDEAKRNDAARLAYWIAIDPSGTTAR